MKTNLTITINTNESTLGVISYSRGAESYNSVVKAIELLNGIEPFENPDQMNDQIVNTLIQTGGSVHPHDILKLADDTKIKYNPNSLYATDEDICDSLLSDSRINLTLNIETELIDVREIFDNQNVHTMTIPESIQVFDLKMAKLDACSVNDLMYLKSKFDDSTLDEESEMLVISRTDIAICNLI